MALRASTLPSGSPAEASGGNANANAASKSTTSHHHAFICQLLDDRAVRPLVAVAVLDQVMKQTAQPDQFGDLLVDLDSLA